MTTLLFWLVMHGRDFVLMKSTDGGDTWNKTVIWEYPYPFFNPAAPFETDTFYCVDGAHHLAFDSEGMVHVVFGINRAVADADGTYWFPLVDGVGYWNENRPTFSNSLEALNPYGEAGSELEEDYSLIGWMQDLDGNDSLDILPMKSGSLLHRSFKHATNYNYR